MRGGALNLVAVVFAGVVAGGSAGAWYALRGSGSSNSLASFMGVSPVPPKAAPGFTLTNQYGRPFSLSQERGKAVVLEFMDSHCTDICPIISQEFVDAYHDLGPKASKVAFVAVNVNQQFNQVSAVAAFTSEHGLNAIPSWQFVTGPVPVLRHVWQQYGISVGVEPNGTVIHNDQMYFIGPHGTERYVATPFANELPNGTASLPAPQITRWGKGIARYAAKVAP